MKLSTWAKQNGLAYLTAYRLFKKGQLPHPVVQLASGTILINEQQEKIQKVVIYSRVSSHDQKKDLQSQEERLKNYCASQGWIVTSCIREIASGLNGRRSLLLKLLNDDSITCIVVEHRDRLARFGTEMLEAALAAQKRKIVIVNESEFKDDLVQDFVDVVTSMCARIYGRRSAKNKAQKALLATQEKI
jgi:putative resolvase